MTLSPPPAQANSSLHRAMESSAIARSLRDDRRRERQNLSQPLLREETSPAQSTPMPPLVPNTPDAAGMSQATREAPEINVDEIVTPQPAGTPATSTDGGDSGRVRRHARPATPDLHDDFFPIIYEGTDDECSFCREPHRDGERVVRFACRHVFHTECWNRWCSERPSRCCPNCRGAGVCIAVWNYIGPGSDTQTVGGVTAPNELERHAQIHNITAPDIATPPTPRSADFEDRPLPGAAASSAALY